ncbi:MAG: hypothetical protein KJ922_03595 [Nanoarchaeota archaeon]|nr:hypothetical protein [Nanoarchaeota archaeon]
MVKKATFHGFSSKEAYRQAKHERKIQARVERREARKERQTEKEIQSERHAYAVENPLYVAVLSTPQYFASVDQQMLLSADNTEYRLEHLPTDDIWAAMETFDKQLGIDVLVLQACNSTANPDLSFNEIIGYARSSGVNNHYVALGRKDMNFPPDVEVGSMNDLSKLAKYLIRQRELKTDAGLQ